MLAIETKEAGASSRLAPDQRTARKARRRIVPLTEEQSSLARKNYRWALKFAKERSERHRNCPWLQSLDWRSAAAIGICDAARTFDPSMGNPFRQHAANRLAGAIADLVREERPKGYRRRARRGRPPRIELLGRQIARVQAEADPVGWELDSEEGFESLIRPLPRIHREVVRLHHLHGQPMTVIARDHGCSLARVSQLHTQAMGWLREALPA